MTTIRKFRLSSDGQGAITYEYTATATTKLIAGTNATPDGRLAVLGDRLYVNISQTEGPILLGRNEDDAPTTIQYAVDSGNSVEKVWKRPKVRTLIVDLPNLPGPALSIWKDFYILEVQHS